VTLFLFRGYKKYLKPQKPEPTLILVNGKTATRRLDDWSEARKEESSGIKVDWGSEKWTRKTVEK
jgi:hypothetical protein